MSRDINFRFRRKELKMPISILFAPKMYAFVVVFL